MLRIGITGQNGFVGRHLFNTLRLYPNEFENIPFDRLAFEDSLQLDAFVSECDVIVHLAALNRHENDQVLADTNVSLASQLVESLERTGSKAYVLISSSTQEDWDNSYGRSKRLAREVIVNWAARSGGKVAGLIIPNVYGAFGRPFYNSFIATFCHQLTHDQSPTIVNDGEVRLIYVQELVSLIIDRIRAGRHDAEISIAPTAVKKVSEVLALLKEFKEVYIEKGAIPVFNDRFELNLFNTFRSYIDYKRLFPRKFQLHTDQRGTFVELIRNGIGGQSSYSTTVPGVTRGNHYHTRKIERFAVIKGEALIQLRKVDSDEVFDFYLDGESPAYVDMPIWYTHSIKNIGTDELITMFWINEPYEPADPDTYFLEV